MAEIATYRCTDTKCRFTVRLSKEFPLWHPETPMHMRAISVSPEARSFVVGFRSESFCIACRSVSDTSEAVQCVKCESTEKFEEITGRACGQCRRGTYILDELKVR